MGTLFRRRVNGFLLPLAVGFRFSHLYSLYLSRWASIQQSTFFFLCANRSFPLVRIENMGTAQKSFATERRSRVSCDYHVVTRYNKASPAMINANPNKKKVFALCLTFCSFPLKWASKRACHRLVRGWIISKIPPARRKMGRSKLLHPFFLRRSSQRVSVSSGSPSTIRRASSANWNASANNSWRNACSAFVKSSFTCRFCLL